MLATNNTVWLFVPVRGYFWGLYVAVGGNSLGTACWVWLPVYLDCLGGMLGSVLRSAAGYLGLALVFVWGGTLCRGLAAGFCGFFARAGRVFVLAGRGGGGWGLGCHSMGYRHFPNVS